MQDTAEILNSLANVCYKSARESREHAEAEPGCASYWFGVAAGFETAVRMIDRELAHAREAEDE